MRFFRHPAPSLLVATLLLMLAAGCSGPQETSEPSPSPEPEERLPQPADDEEEAPPEEVEEPAEPVATTRTLQGFRVQIGMTEDQEQADQRYEEALAWWRQIPARRRPPYMRNERPPLEIDWQAPLYRVRMGAFATRQEAQQALDLIRQQFSDAFIVPDRVTITRVW